MKKLTPEFSEILGLLCAEGSHIISFSTYYGKDRGRKRLFKNDKSERIEFYNKDTNLLIHYQKLLFKEFNYSPRITKHGKVNICKISVIRKIISYTNLGHMKWNVPDEITNKKDNIKTAFLRGYFDGDGTVSNSNIRFFSTNKKGLNKVQNLLESLNFNPTFQGPELKIGRKPLYILHIPAKERESFLKTINPLSKKPVRG